jgi:hypothetical protein
MPAKKQQKNKRLTARLGDFFISTQRTVRGRVSGLLARRPHRSFQRTRRRDYARSFQLPGYWAFTNTVRKLLLAHKKLFVCVALLYATLSVALIGLASQDAYVTLADTLRETGSDLFTGAWGEIGKASLLLATGLTGSLNSALTEAQQVYAILIMLLTWLTAVWLLRSIVAGGKPKLRDGLYSAGAPIVSTFVVLLVIVVQLLPVALAAAGLGAAIASNLISDGGVEAMLFWAAVVALLALSLYWITSTVIALVVVTLPGMYPLKAIKIAGDLVVGRRVRLLLRLLWMGLITAGLWIIIMIPILLLDAWIKGLIPSIEWLPVVPVALMAMTSLTVVWMAAYVYLLYRKVVDDDAAPA